MFSRAVRLALTISVGAGFMNATQAPAAPNDIAAMNAWATEVHGPVVRGPVDIDQPELGNVTFGSESDVIGVASGGTSQVLSLGDGGSITLGFASGISDGPGDDFAVFENGIWTEFGLFAEFAFVEVSSDGSSFARFGAVTTRTTPVWSFEEIDPADYDYFGGGHAAGLGSLFDLSELSGHPLVVSGTVELDDIAYVRVVDVIGDGTTLDSLGSQVWDPYPTPFAEGGFDLDGIGVINVTDVPEPAVALTLIAGWLGLMALSGLRRRRNIAHSPVGLGLGSAFAIAMLGSTATAATTTLDFESMNLDPVGYYNGSDEAGGFVTDGVSLVTTWSFGCCWDGFAASKTTDSTTPGFGNQYSAKPGSGAGGSSSYGVGYQNYFEERQPEITLPETGYVLGAEFSNSTYAYYSMLDGDLFAKKFGGVDGTDPDWFKLTIEGYDELDLLTDTVEFLLADYTGGPGTDTIVDGWEWVDLSSLGAVAKLRFSLTSSDGVGSNMNTPAYFTIDNLVYTPEPGTGMLVGLGLVALAARRPRRSTR